MTDPIKKLQQIFKQETPIKAGKQAKDVVLRAAMRAFAENKSQTHQEFPADKRLPQQDNNNVALLTLSRRRRTMKLSYVLSATAGFAVVALVVINTTQLQSLFKRDDRQLARIEEVKSIQPLPSKSGSAITKSAQPLTTQVVQEMDAVAMNDEIAVSMVAAPAQARRTLSKQMSMSFAPGPQDQLPVQPVQPQGRDQFEAFSDNPLKLTKNDPVSTFSIDVDTASYSFMRAAINRNLLPQKDAVRIEELVNYFPYDYQGPADRSIPFKANVTTMPTPWNAATRLIHIGIKGYDLPKTEKPHANLVFLIDTSGSMNSANKLPLLRNSFKLLLSTLAADDTVAIVSYAGSAGTVLEPTKVQDKAKILTALDHLQAAGSTAGGEGIRLAYQLAESNFDAASVNRVILATDGDFNVGIRAPRELKSFIERKRNSGIFLSVLGFGMGNYNDALMQTLAQNGNGNAAYIDSLSEARKVLLEEASSTLFAIAKDVKIQLEFNPKAVSEYRLIGYETRILKREDFNNDKVDAGEIGSGHTLTALYEITPAGSKGALVEPLRYQTESAAPNSTTQPTEYGFLKLRYKLPDETVSHLIEAPILIADALDSFDKATDEVRFAAAVAAYGQLLRGGQYTGSYGFDEVIELALNAKGTDYYGYRAEFINLLRLAQSAAVLQPVQ